LINFYQRPFFFRSFKDSTERITQINTGREILTLYEEKQISSKTSINNVLSTNEEINQNPFNIQEKINKKRGE